ncbi:MAG: COP23 domain-containing protein, partial [Cyanobacteria bacterium J06631_2]
IGAGYLNNEPVLCAVVEKDQSCSNKNLLVTLPPNTEPITSARLLMDTRGLARGRVIAVSGGEQIEITTSNGNTYYDLEALEQAILAKENSDRLIPISN